MTEREKVLLDMALDKLRIVGDDLVCQGWKPLLTVYGPDGLDGQLANIPGYKVALVVPLDGGLPPAPGDFPGAPSPSGVSEVSHT